MLGYRAPTSLMTIPLAMAVGVLLTGTAAAQTPGVPTVGAQTPAGAQASAQIDEVIVTVPHALERSVTGAPIETVTVSYVVDHNDLDLQSSAGFAELNSRIDAAARSACRRLEQFYPVGTPSFEDCVRNAAAETTNQVTAIARPPG